MWRYLALIITFTAQVLPAAGQKFAIEHAALAQSEDGTPVPRNFDFLPGDVIFFSCQVAGYAKRAREDDSLIDLAYKIEVRDPKGVAVVPDEEGRVASALSAEDKQWLPKIRHTIALPPLAGSGQYQLVVKVKDNFGPAEAQASLPFVVNGRDVAPSDTLTVRNFRFYRAEQDKEPLQAAVYRPGDQVWGRFDMTGYKLAEKNGYDVEYGLKVLRPNGEVTYEQPRAAGDKNESFYPQYYVPGILSLALPQDLKRGDYTIVLSVRDTVGNQSYETREKFVVE